MASRLVKAVLGDGTLTSLPRKKVKIQHVASVLYKWVDPILRYVPIFSYFPTMTCHVLVI